MNISLTPELEQLVKSKVESGLYHSASEVIREGLRLLREQDLLQEARLQELRAQVQAGFRQIEQGDYIEYASPDEFSARITAEARKRHAKEATEK
jgi:antitoxin ParD1/3/4